MPGLTRRKTLALIGGGLVVAAAAGAVDLAQPAAAATAPWDAAGEYRDVRMRALSWAILAPNPHNRQPWKVDLRQAGEVWLYVDTDRLLPHTDPMSRQIVIGLGCFLETMVIAAAQDGYGVDLELFPKGEAADALDQRPVARAVFRTGAAADADFAMIAERRTQKEPYDTARAVPAAALDALTGAMRYGTRAEATADAARVAEMVKLSQDAFEVEFATERTYRESVDLFRIGRAEVNANPDGIDFSGPRWQALHRMRLFTREGAIDPEGFVFRSGLVLAKGNMAATRAHVWMCSAGNARSDQIAAGRDWMRLHLAATRIGLGLHPLSQALQEFPEMAGPHARAHEMMAHPGETVQMWARLGYAPKVPRSPRWPLEAKIMNG